ncbi:hypothetical protein BKA65DRAFT_552655 [Rhexocercosporidium sp. MPI-PUGE-AT-0058]|nr:hypothetical protein BKA65DRAFT_552655 [Rhexocercosporidium sp. MPI-PUGE-AT-0058]
MRLQPLTVTKSSQAKYCLDWRNGSITRDAPGLTIYDIASQDALIVTTGQAHLCTDTAAYAACLLGGSVEIGALIFVPPAAHDFNDS